MTFGEKLQALRKQQKISQEALAEKCDVSRMTVSRWESDQALPDIRQIMKISEFLMVSVDYLLYDRVDDVETGNFSDFHSLRILFWVCIAINICGMVIAMIGWLWVRVAFPVVMGLIMNLLACVFFEIFPPKGIDRVMMRYARRRFYAASVWTFLPAPIFIGIEIVYSIEHYSSLLPYFIGGAVYILVAAIFTIYQMWKYRK
ncbi:MAG: helix-turn-helix domain-containing protein [Oscillospiraceae bacterium]|nr:helix-turn-helix domain-containing protein [Oscillospiraceae bacterium]